ncbi:MAG: hypothetical protein JKX97_02670 [Candidatus Lindowbacteria bacterium]|nr:hypothetical protein [Candidatus Lindowbacteria bacterium]
MIAELFIIAALLATPAQYRITLDVMKSEVTEDNSIEATINGIVLDTGGARILPEGPDVALSFLNRTTKNLTHSRSFVVTIPGSPAKISATTSIPYSHTSYQRSVYGTYAYSSINFIDVGSTLRVTATPTGTNLVRVNIESIESSADTEPRFLRSSDSQIISSQIVYPPQTKTTTLITTVVIPIGSSMIVGGLPITQQSQTDKAGWNFNVRSTSRGGVIRGRDNNNKEIDVLMLLTVNETSVMTRKEADELINDFFSRNRF